MNCGQVKNAVLNTYNGFPSNVIAGEIQRRGFDYPSDIMNSGFPEPQKKNAVLNMLGEYEQSKCNQMRGVGYSLYGGIKRRRKTKKTRSSRRRTKKMRKTRKH